MLKYFLNKSLVSFQRHYQYDVGYLQYILNSDLKAYIKFLCFQFMSSHSGGLPAGPLFAAKLRAIIWDDCGPCTQLMTQMALEAGVNPQIVAAIIKGDFDHIPHDIALVVRFTELVLAHNPEADDLRQGIVAQWGESGLISIAYGISSSRIYPAMKYALGHGETCHHVVVEKESMVVAKNLLLPSAGV